MSVQIQIRGDVAANWSTVNPVLADRELGLETNTLRLKVGNGVTAWNSLPYVLSPTVYQAKLVSGTSLKTINGESLLGSGNIAITGSGAGGGTGGSSRVTKTDVALGTQAGLQADYTYYAVTNACLRGLVSLFRVSADAAALFDLEVRSLGSTAGDLMLAAADIQSASYQITAPWYFESTSGAPTLFIGIRNRGADARTFTLTSLRLEAFA